MQSGGDDVYWKRKHNDDEADIVGDHQRVVAYRSLAALVLTLPISIGAVPRSSARNAARIALGLEPKNFTELFRLE